MKHQRALLDAIYVRDRIKSGMVGRKWIVSQIERLARENVWTDSQIGAIVGYTPGAARRLVARASAREGVAPEGGNLTASCLDIMLSLTDPKLTKEQRGNLLSEAIRTGTSTKLISRICEIPLGSVLYQQRKIKKEENHGLEPQPRIPGALPEL